MPQWRPTRKKAERNDIHKKIVSDPKLAVYRVWQPGRAGITPKSRMG